MLPIMMEAVPSRSVSLYSAPDGTSSSCPSSRNWVRPSSSVSTTERRCTTVWMLGLQPCVPPAKCSSTAQSRHGTSRFSRRFFAASSRTHSHSCIRRLHSSGVPASRANGPSVVGPPGCRVSMKRRPPGCSTRKNVVVRRAMRQARLARQAWARQWPSRRARARVVSARARGDQSWKP